MAWATVVLALIVPGQAQYDPLSIDPLMHPLDPEHTA
jgi:hypothetical protein